MKSHRDPRTIPPAVGGISHLNPRGLWDRSHGARGISVGSRCVSPLEAGISRFCDFVDDSPMLSNYVDTKPYTHCHPSQRRIAASVSSKLMLSGDLLLTIKETADPPRRNNQVPDQNAAVVAARGMTVFGRNGGFR